MTPLPPLEDTEFSANSGISPVNKVTIGGATISIIAIAAYAGLFYLGSPHFQHLLSLHVFSPIQHGTISVGRALLYIGAPTGVALLTASLTIYFFHNHNQRKNGYLATSTRSSLWKTARFSNPCKGKVKKLAISLLVLGIVCAAGWFIGSQIHAAQYWVNSHVLDKVTYLLSKQIKMWQGLAYVGGSTVILSLTTATSVYLYSCMGSQMKESKKMLDTDL